MGFQWNVQPYRFLYELRERYTQTTFRASRKKAYEYAEQATDWMKQNAPWTDRTEAEREEEFLKDPHRVPYPLGARAGLRAVVNDIPGEHAAYKSGISAARKADRATLIQTNAARKSALNDFGKQTTTLVKSGQMSKAEGQRLYTQAKKNYQPLKSLPMSSSAVGQFKKAFKSQQTPVLTITFSHHPRVWYAIWLEIAKGGRWGIINRATAHWGRKFYAEVRRLANLKQYRERIAMGPEPTPREQFDEYAATQTAKTGRPYEEWSRSTRSRRKRRRLDYDPEKSRAWYEQRKKDALEEQMKFTKDALESSRIEEQMRAKEYERQQQYRGPSLNLGPKATRTRSPLPSPTTVRRLPNRS